MVLTNQGTNSGDADIKKMVSEGSPMRSENSHKDLKSIREGGADLARHVKEDTRNIAESMAAEGQHKLDDLKSFAGKHIKNLEKEIAANPMESMAIALGTGALLSFLLRRG
ncbi:MAG: hypothetical protein EA357_11410 [Micavibrio sp.]|nr:MAG: hypothetical protein EA357_11410 [Micavibrio sp.]